MWYFQSCIRLIQFILATSFDITLIALNPQLLTYLSLIMTSTYIFSYLFNNANVRSLLIVLAYVGKMVLLIFISVYANDRISTILSYILIIGLMPFIVYDYYLYMQSINKKFKTSFEHNYYTFQNEPSDDSKSCPICLSPLSQEQYITECKHTFCKQCLDNWINQDKNTCPNCRQALYFQNPV